MASTSFTQPNPNEVLLTFIQNQQPIADIENHLKDHQLDIDYAGNSGETALHLAVEEENPEIVKLLLANHADVDLQKQNGDTALILAVKKENKMLVDILLDHFAQTHISNGRAMRVIEEKLQKRPNDANLKRIKGLLEFTETCYANGLQQSLHGNIFQIKFFMLIHQRAAKGNYRPFRLSSDWNAAGAFDDVVLEQIDVSTGLINEVKFYQTKHKLQVKKKEIDIYELLAIEDDFNISKYFKSFIGVANHEHFIGKQLEFSLVTNTRFEQSLLSRQANQIIEKEDITENEIIHFKSTEFKANKYKLRDNSDEELSNTMKLSLIDHSLNKKIDDHKLIDNFVNSQDLTAYLDLKRKEISCKVQLNQIQYARNSLNDIQNKVKPEIKKYIDFRLSKLKILSNNEKKKFLKSIEVPAIQPDTILEEIRTFFDDKELAVSSDLKRNETNLQALAANAGVPTVDAQPILQKLQEKRKQILKNEGITLQSIKNEIDEVPNFDHNILSAILTKGTKNKIRNCMNSGEIKQILDKKLGQAYLDVAIIEAAIVDRKFDEHKDSFFAKFRFVCEYPSEKQLSDLFANELGDAYKLIDTRLVSAFQFVKIQDFLKNNSAKSHFWTNSRGICEAIENQINSLQISGSTKDFVERLESFGIDFNADSLNLNKLCDFLSEQNEEHQVFYLFSKEPRSSAIKILRILEKYPVFEKQDGHIFNDSQALSQRHLNAFAKAGCNDLMIIEVKGGKLNDELCQNIQNILEESKKEVDQKRGRGGTIPAKRMKFNTENETKIKKIILIKNGSSTDDENKPTNLEFSSDNFEKNHEDDKDICFKHLTCLSQNKLLERDVDFQGCKSKLNELIDENCAKEIFSQPHHLTRLLDTRELCIGDKSAIESWAYVPDYYINREFYRQKINPEVLEMRNQLFFITGATKENLNALGVSDEHILQWHDIENDKEKRNQFKKGIISNHLGQHNSQIFYQFDGDAQWLQFIESKQIFLWMGCKGQIKKEFTDQIDTEFNPNDQAELFNENYFCFNEGSAQKVVLIANDAGMGKSLMLIDLARQMKGLVKNEVDGGNSITNDKWIIRINLNDFARSESPNLNEVKSERAIDFFVDEMVIPGDESNVDIDMQRRLLKFFLANKEESAFRIIIMLDGFDEDCPDYRDVATRLIKALKNSEVAQIYVTTRIHQKDHLEQELQTPAFNLKPWVEKYQTEFLQKFWKWILTHESDSINRQIKAKSNKQIRDYLATVKNAQNENENYKEELVQSISAILGKCSDEEIKTAIEKKINFTKFIEAFHERWNDAINDRDKQFVSIPLQLRMLSEITFEKKFTMPTNKGLSSLYDEFIKMKFEIYGREKAKIVPGSTSAKPFEKTFHQKMHKMHKALALRLFFPEHIKDLPKLGCLDDLNDETNSENAKEEREDLAKVGLLTLIGNELRFIHRSFAEYFVSRYLIDNLRNERVQVLLIDKILSTYEYELIHKFFNDQIEKELKNDFQFDLQHEAKMILFMKRGIIFERVISGNRCGICKLLLKSIRHDKQLHEIIMTGKRGGGFSSIHSCELLDILLDEFLLLDDKTIENEFFGFSYDDTPSDLIIEKQDNDVIVRFIKRLKNGNRLNSEKIRRALIGDSIVFKKVVSINPMICIVINVSAIVMILEHLKWPANVRKELMLTPDSDGSNILSQMAKQIHENEHFKNEQAREIAQKLFENIDDSDEKYFEDLAIICIGGTSAECFDKLLDIVAFNSKFHKKLIDVFDVNVNIKQKKCALIDAIEEGELERVRDILNLRLYAKKLVLLNDGQMTALHVAIAANSNRIEIIEEIFNSLAEEKPFLKQLLLWSNEKQNTVLQLAAENGYTDIVRLLLEKSSEDRDLLKELFIFGYYWEKKAIELAYKGKHLEIVGIILQFAIDNCVEIIEDLVENTGGMQTASECLKSTEYLGRLFESNTQYRQIYNLFQAVRENGTNVPDLLDEIRGNDDTIEKLLLSKDLERNSFFVLSIQKGNEDALNFIRDFLREHIYFGYYYLLSDAQTAKTSNTQVDILNWVKENLDNDYTFPGEKISSLVVRKQLDIATYDDDERFETFLSILEWAKDKMILESMVIGENSGLYLRFLADNWRNPIVPPVMDLILDNHGVNQNLLNLELIMCYDHYECIFIEMENYPRNTSEDKRVVVSSRLKSIFNEMANSVWQADDLYSFSESVGVQQLRSNLEKLKKFVEYYYSGENDKAAILAKIEYFLELIRY